MKKNFWPFLAKQAGLLFGKIRKFRENKSNECILGPSSLIYLEKS
ncbi:hypothetical protein T4B_10605 [Trichinella pseudospiralis]|uniref:Uncharacterized protein n=1 Tax=Trichinella pseudospiralis TaxID=6337 RepID=A0A0V1GPT9_TRIPS|nr:hypothetical protein T4B_10605 [Trichinella pseudospiralis]